LASIMAMFRTSHDSSAEVFHGQKKRAESEQMIDRREMGRKVKSPEPSVV
jgi:hypothetical protein